MGETSYRIEITGRENFEWQGILARNGEPPVRFESLLQMILMIEGKEKPDRAGWKEAGGKIPPFLILFLRIGIQKSAAEFCGGFSVQWHFQTV